jgi:hypothetical protein
VRHPQSNDTDTAQKPQQKFFVLPFSLILPLAPASSFIIMSKKKRPGVQAGINLVALTTDKNDDTIWRKVEAVWDILSPEISGLQQLECSIQSFADKSFLTKVELDLILTWKFTVGKNRAFNRKLLLANTDTAIQTHSRQAIAMAKQFDSVVCLNGDDGTLTDTGRTLVREAIQELAQLRGVGPATASAVLALVAPAFFCFMYDEVIDSFQPVRNYTLSTYLDVNNRCLQIAHTLDFTPSRVAKILWTASRYLALFDQDLTKGDEENEVPTVDNDDNREHIGSEEGNAKQVRVADAVTSSLRRSHQSHVLQDENSPLRSSSRRRRQTPDRYGYTDDGVDTGTPERDQTAKNSKRRRRR